MNNRNAFCKGEADSWFQRNIDSFSNKSVDKPMELLCDWLKPFESDMRTILEIGCGTGHRLSELTTHLNASGYGVEPSPDAVNYIGETFPSLACKVGFGDDVPFNEKFDLVHLGFFLYLVDRDLFLKCVSEADRLVKPGGFLSIIDFATPYPYSNKYSHLNGVYAHKKNNSDVFVASGLYSVVNKFHFSHNGFCFDKQIDERVSLTLLYKEVDIFKNDN